jgi:hypothetical protein
MSNISLPYGFLEGSSLNDKKITAFATKRIEPIFNGAKHYANRVIFNIEGEYLPQGIGGNIPNALSPIDIKTFLDSFTSLTNGNCTLTNINLQESNWIGHVPYSVDCECYAFVDDNLNKTISANNEINVTENIDGTITISRNINVSAVSIAGSNAVQDARTFAQLLSGQTTNWRLNFSSSNKSQNFSNVVLNSSSETADIFNGSYAIQQNFTTNLLNKDLSKKGVVKNSIEIQSGIDGLASINKKSTIIGGLNTTENELKTIALTNSFNVPSDFSVLSNTSSYDDIGKTLEVNTIYSNDKTINSNGNKVTNSLSFNYDFFNETYNANFNSEVRPAKIIKTTTDVKNDLVKNISSQLKNYDPINATFILESSAEGTGIITQLANYTETYISSPNVIGGLKGIQFYDLALNVDYQPGYPQNTFTPILSGKGKYYLENLDVVNNSIINITINGKYVDNPPDKKLFENAAKSGDLVVLSKTLILKDEIGIDYNSKTFNYTQQKVGNDQTFKDIT